MAAFRLDGKLDVRQAHVCCLLVERGLRGGVPELDGGVGAEAEELFFSFACTSIVISSRSPAGLCSLSSRLHRPSRSVPLECLAGVLRVDDLVELG